MRPRQKKYGFFRHSATVVLIAVFSTSLMGQGLKPTPEYITSVNQALSSKTDVWGEEALKRPEGPTYDTLKDKLHPLMHLFKWYSESEIYYLPFGMQDEVGGGTDFALHYADGSQIVSRRSEIPPAVIPANAPPYAGKRITFFVGANGNERYGSDLARLPMPTLGNGYLPILNTEYSDASGVKYSQESFAIRIPESKSLASFVKLTISNQDSKPKAIKVRLHFGFVKRSKPPTLEDEKDLQKQGNRVVSGNGDTYLVFSQGATLEGADLIYTVNLGASVSKTLYFVRPNEPAAVATMKADAATYRKARTKVAKYWNARLNAGARFTVPEPYAMDAQKNILIQNLLMNWLYSIGNPYEVHYNAEGHDSVQALGLFGYLPEYKKGLELFLQRQSANYEKGERLLHAADYYFLTRDRSLVDAQASKYNQFADDFVREMGENNDLLRKEPGGTDISGESLHYNINHQAVAWRGWRDMLEVRRELGQTERAVQYAPKVAALRNMLLKEATLAAHRYADDALYVPNHVRGKDPGPFDSINATKEGSYWLLVATDGYAAGPYDQQQKEAILKYIHNYGGTMIGMVRFNYLSTPVGGCAKYGLPGYEVQGDDNAYAPPYFKLLSDAGERDRLVLSFYGKLAHGMTRNTFVSGEGESIGVCEDPEFFYGSANKYYRTLYLSPNSTNNAAYLLALRYMLIRESQDQNGAPDSLFIADATPRTWLQDGKSIQVQNAPTYFGPISYTIHSHLAKGNLEVELTVPDRNPIRKLELRLRTPGSAKINSVLLNGSPYAKFNPTDETVDLSGQTGKLKLQLSYNPTSAQN